MDIVVLIEIYLDCLILSEEVISSDYIVYWKDCVGNWIRCGGGVLIVVKKGLIILIWEYYDLFFELFFVDIIMDGKKKLMIGIFYRLFNSDLKFLEDFWLCFFLIIIIDFFVIGDFNLSEFDWFMNYFIKLFEYYYFLFDIIYDNFLY